MVRAKKSTLIAIGCALGTVGFVAFFVFWVVAGNSLLNRLLQPPSESIGIVNKIATLIETHYLETCKFPESLPPTSPVPTGGDKLLPSPDPRWKEELGLNFEDPTYFSYSTVQVDSQTMHAIAKSDMIPGGPQHTYFVEMKATGDCQLEMRTHTLNEFQ